MPGFPRFLWAPVSSGRNDSECPAAPGSPLAWVSRCCSRGGDQATCLSLDVLFPEQNRVTGTLHVAALPLEQSLEPRVWVCGRVRSWHRVGLVLPKPVGTMASPE